MHIEMGQWQKPTVKSDVVIAAGDIGLVSNLPLLKKYFDDLRKTTDHIIYVLGNHEFYNYDYPAVIDEAADFAKEEGIHFLEESIGTDNLVLDGVTFWGSTLWTDLKGGDRDVMRRVGYGMNDFRIITNSTKGDGFPFTAHDSILINERTREKINWDADVVITHHHPLLRLHKNFPMSDITYGFCNTGLEDKIRDSDVKLFVFGHTHDSTDEDLDGTRVVSNQQGYPRRDWHTGEITYENAGFNPGLIIEVDPK